MRQFGAVSALCVVLLLTGVSQADALKNVVTVALNVASGTFTCQDYFQGDANAKYTAILQTYDLQGLMPSVSCRQQGNTVHTLELVGAEPGANLLFDDARKVSEAVAELRNLSTTNRVSLYVNYFFTTASPETSQALFNTLNANIRSGDFLAKATAAIPYVPLLTAVTYQEVFNGGVAC